MKMEFNRVILVGMAARVNINDMQCSNGKKGRQKRSLKCLYTETLSQSHDSVGLHYLAWLRLCYCSLPPSHVFCHSCDSSTVWQCSVLVTITVCAGEILLAWTCCSVDGRIIISFHFGAPCVGNLLADKGHPKDGRIMVWSISILGQSNQMILPSIYSMHQTEEDDQSMVVLENLQLKRLMWVKLENPVGEPSTCVCIVMDYESQW